jgi:hypothetical protein
LGLEPKRVVAEDTVRMISYPMYLFNYPLGHLIAFQIEEPMKKTGKLWPESKRMAKFGAVTPEA